MKDRIKKLTERFYAFPTDLDKRDQEVLEGIFMDVFANNKDKSHVVRRADYMETIANNFPVRINPYELIVGTDIYEIPGELSAEYQVYSNGGHYSPDYNSMLILGIDGLLRKLDESKACDDIAVENLTAGRRVLLALSVYIDRYADEAEMLALAEIDILRREELYQIRDNCREISHDIPKTFMQALQLVYFIQIFLHIEGIGANSMSFGRLDQFLFPFYEFDCKVGILDSEAAEELLGCFAEKVSHCDVSQNLALGGVDSDGSNAENELTYLFLKMMSETDFRQPSLSLRVTKYTSDKVWQQALTCVASGNGMPSFFNDEVVINSLVNTGTTLEDARNYVLIGCYEANSQGNTFGLTVALGLDFNGILLEFLNQSHDYENYDLFYKDFLEFFTNEYDHKYMPSYQNTRNALENLSASPFWACLLEGCIETGRLPEQYGAKYNWLGLDCLGIGTLTDSLYTIKRLIYEEKLFSLAALKDQLRNNFSDDKIWLSCRNLDGKYGTNSDASNKIAKDFADYFSDLVLSRKLEHNVTIYPALFQWMGDVYASEYYPATPDGRRKGDRLSYGVTSSEIAKNVSHTSMLSSVAQMPLDKYACGSPVMLSYPPRSLKSLEGKIKLRQLIDTFFELGGFHIQLNSIDKEVLKSAQKEPENYKNLMIRISGHSNYFVVLDQTLQNALIERVAAGR